MIFWRKEKSAGIEEAPAQPVPEPEPEAPKESWLSRLGKGLSKSSNKFTTGITDLITKKKLDQEMLDSLEDLLIVADLGPKTAADVVADFGRDRFGKDLTEKHHRKNVMIAAGDTFRAAAIEQLEIWAKRSKSSIVMKGTGSDAAAVAFEAYEEAKQTGADVLLIDTAGRLHNKSNLMAELQKIVRVLKKQNENLPHAVLLVLDATTGQNALEQVKIFKEMVNVTGLAVTKLDGSARGGIVVALADRYKLPIHLIGVGEQADDLQPFEPGDYARSLVGL
jgi:fused signal recognition particle receptor